MRIAIPRESSSRGGDAVVIDEIARQLRNAGHDVREMTQREIGSSGADVAHLFNLTRPFELAEQVRALRDAGIPYVLTPIYWDLFEGVPWSAYEFPRSLRMRLLPAGLRRRLGRAEGPGRASVGRFGRDVRTLQAEILQNARYVFPSTVAERDHLLACHGPLDQTELVVVRHGVHLADLGDERSQQAAEAAELARGALVCAGTIGPRKNQLLLARASRLVPALRFLILGDVAAGGASYGRAVERAAGAQVAFHPSLPRAAMRSVLANARALVQPSHVETPGLAALEAAALGLPVVLAAFPPVLEVFGSGPGRHYCDPNSPASIARACRDAAASPRSDASGFAAENDWTDLSQPLLEAYEWLAKELPSAGHRS